MEFTVTGCMQSAKSPSQTMFTWTAKTTHSIYKPLLMTRVLCNKKWMASLLSISCCLNHIFTYRPKVL